MKNTAAADRWGCQETSGPSQNPPLRADRVLLLVGLLALAVPIHAEAPALDQAQNPPPSSMGGNTAATADDTGEPQWKFESQVSLALNYDDNLFIQPSNTKGDLYGQIAPTLAFGRGDFRSAVATFAPIPHFLAQTGEEELPRQDYAFASYTPDLLLYSKYTHEDTVNHDARLAAQKENDLWNLQGDFHFQRQTEPDIDVGRRITETDYIAEANGTYALSGKLTGGTTLYGDHSDYSGGLASTEGRIIGYLDYQIAPKTAMGVGAGGGYLDVASGANQVYEQSLLQLTYQPTAKLSFTGQAGAEFRQYYSRLGNRVQSVFNGSGNYQATDSTLLTVTAKREVLASAEYSGEDILATTFEGGIRQRFWQALYLALSGGYVRDHYENNEPAVAVIRHDDYYFYQITASRDISKNGTIELSYEYRKNESSLANFSFTDNLVGAAVAILF